MFGFLFSCNSPEKCLKKGQLALEEGNPEKAAEYFEKALEKSDAPLGEAWLGLAQARSQMGMFFEKIEAYRKVSELMPEVGEAWFELAQHDPKADKRYEAATQYLNFDPESGNAWKFRANAAFEVGKLETAQSDLEKWKELESAPADQYELQARIYEASGQYLQALEAWEAAGQSIDGQAALEKVKQASRDGDEAARAWLITRGLSDSTFARRADAYFVQEKYVGALELYEKALKTKPEPKEKARLKALSALTRAHLVANGHFDDERNALVNRGRADAFRLAEADAKVAVKADESLSDAHFALGMIDFYQRLFPDAKDHFLKTKETAAPDQLAEVHYYLAYCQYETKEYKNCVETATAAIEGGIAPSPIPGASRTTTPPAYLRLLVLRGRAYQNWDRGYSDKALQDFNEAVNRSRKAGWTLKWRGLYYKSRGNYDAAFTDLRMAVERGEKGDPEVFEALKWMAENRDDRRFKDFMNRHY